MSKKQVVAMISTTSGEPFRVERLPANDAFIRIGQLGVYMGMEQLRDLNNEIAATLHNWYEERDRNGAS